VAIDKRQTPTWVKVVIIVVVVAFVGSVPIAALVSGTQGSSQGTSDQFNQTTGTAGAVDSINAKYAPTTQALQQSVASQPESYTALVGLGNTYMDWAAELQSQGSTASAGAALPLWTSAKDAYGKALAVKPGESAVEGDFAITMFNLGDTKGAIIKAEEVLKRDPKFGPMWFNVAIFYANTGQTEKAINAYEQYLKVEPNGAQKDAATAALQQLKSGQ